MTIQTTLADIRAAKPCETFSKICDHFGVSATEAKTHREPFPVSLILETNGLDDTLWVLDNVIGNKHLCRLFAADCAESVLHIFEKQRPNDDRPRNAIAAARDSSATDDMRKAAAVAARAAARAASRAAAWAAARAAADAAGGAAWAAARAASDAAGAAADAASDVARDAARAAADAAWAAAWAAARAAQTERLKQYLEHGESASGMLWPTSEVAT